VEEMAKPGALTAAWERSFSASAFALVWSALAWKDVRDGTVKGEMTSRYYLVPSAAGQRSNPRLDCASGRVDVRLEGGCVVRHFDEAFRIVLLIWYV
jgi:hypothetical protein